jgi:hypothetical protein
MVIGINPEIKVFDDNLSVWFEDWPDEEEQIPAQAA